MSIVLDGVRKAELPLAARNLVDLLRIRAAEQATKPGYVFLDDGEREGARLSYADLDRRARAIATHLTALGPTGARALLLYPPGLDYIEAFFGCLYAGVIAVPAYPPSGRHLQRLQSIFRDARPAAILTTEALRQRFENEAGEQLARIPCSWTATDVISSEQAEAWRAHAPEPDQIAFLQYTSGSTGDPRGVMVTHANLLSNQALIKESFGHDERSDLVGWLPLYHDMGLIGNILQPLYIGATAYLMSPMAFLEKPLRWLKAISTYRAHTSGGPNFAFDLCVRKIKEEEKRDLDLSHWRIAFSGAEPVRASTLDRFARGFAISGFRRDSFYPCYGLAEATLVVTAPTRDRPLPIVEVDRQALEARRVAPSQGAKSTAVVGCGHGWPGYDVQIVDPESTSICAPGEIGEIWVAGPGVALGYWNRPDDTARVFGATVAEGDGRAYLRTGDLGFLERGEIFVAGRLKDLIIVAGRNFHPQDIECVIDEQIEGLRRGSTAAFPVTIDDREALIVVAEPDRSHLGALENSGGEALFRNIRTCVVNEIDVEPADIVLVQPGSVPKTSSGKLRRAECRQRYLSGELRTLARAHSAAPSSAAVAEQSSAERADAFLREALSYLAPAQKAALLTRFLISRVARSLGAPESDFSPTTLLSRSGLSSLRAIEVKHSLDSALGIETPIGVLLSDASFAEAAEALARLADDDASSAREVALAPDPRALSHSQHAMWTVHQLDAASNVYNLHLALDIDGPLDFARFHRALSSVVERHAQLRTVYRSGSDGVTQEALPLEELADWLRREDATAWTSAELEGALSQEARRPFDLDAQAPFRIVVYSRGDGGSTLLFVAHHIAVDLWSLLLLVSQLDAAYLAPEAGDGFAPPASGDYAEFTRREANYLASPAAERDWSYWSDQLRGPLPALELPTDFPRPSVPDYAGGSAPLRLDHETTHRLKELAKREGVSLFSLLLAGYFALLQRVTGQPDLVVGAPTSGRLGLETIGLVGNCVNPVALRVRALPQDSFEGLLRATHATVRGALEHQQFPFPLIVDRLQPERHENQWPIYQSWFVLQQAQSEAPAEFAALALGEDGPSFSFCGRTARSSTLRERVEMFDLAVMAAEVDEELLLSFQFKTQLFAAATIERLARRYRALLDGILDNPQARIGDLPILEEAERGELIFDWNDTSAEFPRDLCVHELFEAQAQRRPDAVAAIFGDDTLTYGELNARANRLARHLVGLGVGPEAIVGLCVERSLEMVVGLLGVLKAGGAYLPLDPDYPSERLAYMIADASPRLVLTQQRLAERLPVGTPLLRLDADREQFAHENAEALSRRATPQNVAYVIYTSGSTGKPKGVAAPHGGVVNRIDWMQKRYGLTADDTVLQKTPFGFDVSAWEFFWPLQAGARLALAAPDDHREPARLAELIQRHSVTTLHFVPSMLRAFSSVVDMATLRSLRLVICSGEELPAAAARRFHAATAAELHNLYGPTEASIDVSAYRCAPDDDSERVPIGRPISNIQLYILDAGFEPIPVGVAGELCIGGVGLARGYLGRADLTAERFVANPFVAGERMYRTGDLARWRRDGNIEFLGRLDHQVKIRGFRIELGEIEAVLQRLPDVREAVALAWADGSGDKRLAAYVTSEGELDFGALKIALRRELPDYMVPQLFVRLEALPLTASGKLDRKALPDPDPDAQSRRNYVAPRTPTEETLCRIFADVLGVERVGVDDSFFELGGDSIRAIQVASRLQLAGYELTPRQLFQYPAASLLASELTLGAEASPISDVERALAQFTSPFALAELEADDIDRIVRRHGDVEDLYPLTPMQEGMLFHALSQTGTGLYHMQERYEIRGPLDIEAFAAAWRRVVDRHASLRTSFEWDLKGRAHQVVHSHATLPVDILDLRHLSNADQSSNIDQLLSSERERGFDLATAPLMRIKIIRVDDDRHICVRSFHHIIMDDWCTSPLLLDVRKHYAAGLAGQAVEAEPAGQFRDYIAWLRTKDMASAESFWRSYLDGFSEPTPLVGAKAIEIRADAAASVDDVIVTLSAEDRKKLEALARQHRLTVNTYVQGALALLLGRYADVDEVVFGVTVAGRPIDLPSSETALGLFINGLPLRVRIRPDQPIIDWLKEIMSSNLEMRQHEFVSQSMIQSWSSIPRADALLFQHLLTFENAPIDPSLRGEKEILDIDLLQLRVHTNYPITFVAIPGETLTLRLTYDRDRFAASTVERMAIHFRRALEKLIAKSDRRVRDVQLLPPAEGHRAAVEWNETDHDYGEPLDLVRRFEAQAALRPDSIVAACEGKTLTYRALDERANHIASALVEAGVGRDDIVALWETRGLNFLATMLGVFKAGAAYLPIDPAYPDGRILQVLKEAEVEWLWAGKNHLARASALCADLDEAERPRLIEPMTTCAAATMKAPRHNGPRNLAFVIFTSGSTGRPKGVMVEHRGMFNNLITKERVLALTSDDVIAQTASQCFDISVWQFLTAIAIGARVEIFPDDISRDPQRLLDEIDRRKVTILEAVPSMIKALLDVAEDDERLVRLRWLLPCGEAFTPELCRRFMARFPNIRLLNAYGPAECSDDVSYYPIESSPEGDDLSVPIGRPVDNTQLYILNRRLDLAPVGVAGEICVAGVQVGRGYLHRPDLTAQSFVPDPFGPPGSVLYRTGDLGRYRSDGVIEFLGRVDHQVKIRGHRIEPGEIEACLVTHPRIEEACVVARRLSKNLYGLIAYVVAPQLDASSLREHVLQTLPEFMVPSAFICMESLPLTSNGKVDRKKLPDVDASAHVSRVYVPPRNATEEILCKIWSEVLDAPRVGVEDNFFELGGHSLLAIQLRSRIRAAFGVEMPLPAVFDAATVAKLAERVEDLILADIEELSDVEASRRARETVEARA
ncbi:amino acid adenylation domain-containing protein [Methylosinus sp. sav-2]|uniref:non-ribosomal peptide synthetase n=2 Tax=unclassified Methylosinus TaxID=2624500 RepID=UPI00068E5FDA|nr:non-ribosomal peptide synthetase [Methylosinus sp. sav-2]TDX61141.1 amino acid adenylation domain-containing protein [Methylosinus sp. sav-2]